MVVGPLMQGVVLAGIIYWYSKGMMSLINDYYRSEFHRKLRDVNETAADTPDYDLDNFESLLDVESVVKSAITTESPAINIGPDLIFEDLIILNEQNCFAPTAIDIFLYIIGLNGTQQEMECWKLNKESNLEHKIS